MSSSSNREFTLQQFEDRIASDSPTPGGGALAAVTVSFAAALLQMCLAITRKKQPAPAITEAMDKTVETLAQLRGTADEDIAAFDAYLAALRLPKSDEDEKLARHAAMHSALLEAARVPLEAAGRTLDLAELAIGAVSEVSPVVLSDLGTALELLRASAKSLLLNVETNIRGLKTVEDEDAQRLLELYAETSARFSRLDPNLGWALTQIAERIRQ